MSGDCSRSDDATHTLSDELVEQGFRLACQAGVESALVVEVPAESMFEHRQKILTGDTGNTGNFNPVTRKVYFELSPPTSEDVRSDLARLHDALGDEPRQTSGYRAWLHQRP